MFGYIILNMANSDLTVPSYEVSSTAPPVDRSDKTKILNIIRRKIRESGHYEESVAVDENGVPLPRSTPSVHEILKEPHYFKTFIIGEGLGAVQVHIPQLVGESYGTYVWPAAVVLAQYIWDNSSVIKGQHVLEIGAGTALPGITAAKLHASVTLSDTDRYPKALESCRKSCIANNLDLPVKCITWGQFDPDLFDLEPVDIVLGSDCFFDPSVFEDVIVTVSFLLRMKPSSQFWCSYHERSANWDIDWLLRKWGLVCHEVELPEVGIEPLLSSDSLHIYIIALATTELL